MRFSFPLRMLINATTTNTNKVKVGANVRREKDETNRVERRQQPNDVRRIYLPPKGVWFMFRAGMWP